MLILLVCLQILEPAMLDLLQALSKTGHGTYNDVLRLLCNAPGLGIYYSDDQSFNQNQ